ncbi:TIGR04282 family arsenosugar biosynthesis glycosyltransferase [Flagellimonas sp. 2504JD4-2]
MNNKGLQETAVLIFANSAEVDARKKTTIPKTELFQEFIEHTLKVVRQSGLPFFHISEKEQHGSTFGERFAHAIQSIYDRGYENVITIGNDSPELRAHHLTEASKQLKQGKTVLGPTLDGGFYLMGLHQSNFDAQLFQKLPWQRVGLFHKISQLFRTNNSTLYTLPTLRDIDVLEDVKVLLKFIGRIPKAVFKILADLTNTDIQFFDSFIPKPEIRFITFSFNKGSPNPLLSIH